MNIAYLNGTSSVMPMQGTSSVVPMQGCGCMQGTSSVMPMQGTSSVMPMQGLYDFEDMPLQGTNSIPMQGTYGQYYIHPLAAMDISEVPMQGVPADADPDDILAYQLAYMVGDRAAVNGLFSGFKERRAARHASRDENKALNKQKKKEGSRFIDKFGSALANVGEGLKSKLQADAELTKQGIEPDDEILTQRALKAADSTGSGAGLMGLINGLSTTQKVMGAAGLLLLSYGVYRVVTKGKKRRKR